MPFPPFDNFSLDTLNSEQKLSVKNRLTGPVRNRSTGRSTGDDFEIYRSGRVEKILTGSISGMHPQLYSTKLFYRIFCISCNKIQFAIVFVIVVVIIRAIFILT